MQGYQSGELIYEIPDIKEVVQISDRKDEKSYPNVAPFSKMPTWNKFLLEILNAKVTNTFKLIQIQQEKKSYQMFTLLFQKNATTLKKSDISLCGVVLVRL